MIALVAWGRPLPSPVRRAVLIPIALSTLAASACDSAESSVPAVDPSRATLDDRLVGTWILAAGRAGEPGTLTRDSYRVRVSVFDPHQMLAEVVEMRSEGSECGTEVGVAASPFDPCLFRFRLVTTSSDGATWFSAQGMDDELELSARPWAIGRIEANDDGTVLLRMLRGSVDLSDVATPAGLRPFMTESELSEEEWFRLERYEPGQ